MRTARFLLMSLLLCALTATFMSAPPRLALAQPQPDVDGRFTETFNGDVGRRAAEGRHSVFGQLLWTTPVEGVEAGSSCVGCPTGPQQHGGIVLDRSEHLLVPTLTEGGRVDQITALDLADGSVAWTSRAATGGGKVRPGCLSVDEDGFIWTLTTDGANALIALDPASGQEQLSRRIEVDAGFSLSCRSGLHLLPGNRAAAFDGTYHTLHVWDLQAGSELWQTTPAPGTFTGGDLLLTSADGQRLYLLDDDDGNGPDLRLQAYDVDNGTLLGEVAVPGNLARVFPMATALVDVDGGVLLTTADGYGETGDGHVIHVTDDGGTLALDWQLPSFYSDPDDAFGGTPTQLLSGGVDGRTVVAIDSWGDQLLGLDLADGSQMWQTAFPRAADPLGFEAMTDAGGNILLPWAVAGINDAYPPWDTLSPAGVPLASGPVRYFDDIVAFGPLGPDGTLYGNAVIGQTYVSFAVTAGQPGQGELSVAPTTVGDGWATLQLRGSGAQALSSARLTRAGEVRTGEVFTSAEPNLAHATFDLSGAVHGEWELTADGPGGTQALGSIVVESATPTKDITVATFVRDAIRSGVSTNLAVHVRNNGNVDVNALPVVVALEGLPPGTELVPLGLGAPPPVPADAPGGFSADDLPVVMRTEGRSLVPVLLPVLGPGSTTTVQLQMTIPVGTGALESGRLVARAGACWVTNDGQPADFLSGIDGQAFAAVDTGKCVTDLLTTGFTGIVGPLLGPLGDCVLGSMAAAPSVINDIRDGSWVPVSWAVGMSTLSCVGVFVPQVAIPAQTNLALNLVASALLNCGDKTGYKDFVYGGSVDPNDIIGPPGAGEPRWLTAVNPLDYTVRFENQADAAFPAAQVVVTHTLDADFDPVSVVLGPIGWDDVVLTPPAGARTWDEQFFTDGVLVAVQAGWDGTTLTWNLRTLDPTTGLPPEDASVGFLPPNVAPPQGEGFVSFTVAPYPTVSDGTVVDAQADITFDINPPIRTNVWANTFDQTPPNATASATVDPSPRNDIMFELGGSDNLSGVVAWQLDAAVGLGPAQRIDVRHTADNVVVPAPRGQRVTLLVQAIDGAGNTQPSPYMASGSVADSALVRLAGPTRLDTAVAISHATFRQASTVVLARADTYPDALAGAPLAFAMYAPILLTESASLSAATAQEITRLGATTAIVLGGEAALGRQVVTDLQQLGLSVSRVAGSSRFATAAAVADQLDPPDRVFVVEGANADPARGWPDALAVAPLAARLGAPILLVTHDDLPIETLAALRMLDPARVTIVGGTAAVGDRVATQIRDAGFTVDRIAGADRYGTGLAVVDEALAERVADPLVTWLATGLNFPDALAAGPAVASTGGQLLLVHGQVPSASQPVLDRIGRDGPNLGYARLAGGTAAISATTEQAVREVLDDSPFSP